MTLQTPFILSGSTLTVYFAGIPKPIDVTHPNFQQVIDLLKAGPVDRDELERLLDLPAAIRDKIQVGNLVVHSDGITYHGEPIHNYMVERILTHIELGLDAKPLLKALDSLLKNPDFRVREQLYRFLEAAHIAFTPEGRFLAFKKVRDDYKDQHSGTFDNSIGQVLTMPRDQVDPDPDETCSHGLHVCSFSYLGSYMGNYGKVVIVAVWPEDVVAVPRDYNDAKMRTCRYEVVGELEGAEAEQFFAGRYLVDDYVGDEDEGDDGDFDEDKSEDVRTEVAHAVGISVYHFGQTEPQPKLQPKLGYLAGLFRSWKI